MSTFNLSLTDIANAATLYLGIRDQGEGLNNTQLNDALKSTNFLLDNWSSEGLFIGQDLVTAGIPLIAGDQAYTIGNGQTINITRPVKIQAASFTNASGEGGPIAVVDERQWSVLTDRQSQSNHIKYLFYDRGYPFGSIYLSPVPLSANPKLELHTWVPFTQFPDLTTTVLIVPGYVRVMELGLAIELAPQYNMAVPPSVAALYSDALERVKRLNASLLGDLPPENPTPQEVK